MPTTTTPHRIGWAVKQAKAGHAVMRTGWKVPGQRVSYRPDREGSQSYLLLTTRSGRSWPATLGHRDLLAEDWALAT